MSETCEMEFVDNNITQDKRLNVTYSKRSYSRFSAKSGSEPYEYTNLMEKRRWWQSVCVSARCLEVGSGWQAVTVNPERGYSNSFGGGLFGCKKSWQFTHSLKTKPYLF